MINIIQTVSDGDYTVEVVSLEGRVDAKQRKMVEWDLRILGGTYDQCVLAKKHYLVSPKAIEFLTTEFGKLGFTIRSGADMEAQKQQIVGKRIDVSIKKNEHGYLVIYVKGLAKGQAPPAAQSGEW